MPGLVSFVIPTLNEEEAIGPTLDALPLETLEKAGWETEVLIVDGASTDRTREIAEEKGARVIVEERKGYGRAYKTGFDQAKGDVLITGDADGTYPFEMSHELVAMLDEEHLDFITTDRFAELEPGAMSLKHRFGNWVLSATCRVLYGAPFKDSQSGMWIFRRHVLDKITLTSDGMPLSEEIKIEAFSHPGVRAREIGIPYRERIGEVKLDTWGDGRKNLMFLFEKRFGR